MRLPIIGGFFLFFWWCILSLDFSRTQVGHTSLNHQVRPTPDIDDRVSMTWTAPSTLPAARNQPEMGHLVSRWRFCCRATPLRLGAVLVPGPTPSTDGQAISAQRFGRTQVCTRIHRKLKFFFCWCWDEYMLSSSDHGLEMGYLRMMGEVKALREDYHKLKTLRVDTKYPSTDKWTASLLILR